jgi:hypothetical protein
MSYEIFLIIGFKIKPLNFLYFAKKDIFKTKVISMTVICKNFRL